MSTVAKKIMMGSGAVAEAYEIEQSVIMESSGTIYRTPSSSGNRRTWTLSVWAKRNSLGAWSNIVGGQRNSPASYVYFNPDNQIAVNGYQSGVPTNFYTETTRVLRDVSAWYHIVVNWDTTQSTAANRIKIWVNGVQETSFDVLISPSLNFQADWNLAGIPQYVGSDYSSSNRANAQLAEMHWLDGATKSPSDFGETNDDTGQWIPKEYEGGSYGTNGFYLKFASGAIGTDSSGQGNTHSIANLANADVVIDTPTNNFSTLNPLSFVGTNGTISEGNLKAVGGNYPAKIFPSTIAASSGKWYAEFLQSSTSYPMVGVSDAGLFMSLHSNGGIRGSGAITWDLGSTNGRYYINSTSETDNAGKGSAGSIIQVAFDADSRKVWFGINNTWQGSGNPAAGSNQIGVVAQTGALVFFMRPEANTQTANFGQKTFAYTPPSGFSALSTANLPAPAIPLPSAQFNTLLYTGNDADGRTISGVGFQPDFVWQKARNATNSNWLFDAVRGATKFLSSNEAASEYTQADSLSAFTSDGFTVSDNTSGADMNSSSHTYVTWNWKANGSGSTDTSGDINATVSANPTAGFSIVKYTATSDPDATVPHGLGVAPEMVFYKWGSSAWYCWTTVIDGSNDRLVLDRTDAKSTVSASYGSFTSSFIRGIDVSTGVMAYCFVSKPSFSKVGIYTGNGSADGPMVNTGFKPAWLMIKNTSNAQDWILFDTKRNPFNEVKQFLYPNLSADEGAGSNVIDLVSNGFKLRNAGTRNRNYNGDVYLYMAFAESPFKTANAR